MIKHLIHWVLSALTLLLLSRVVPGFHVRDLKTAIIAALVIGLLNVTVGLLLKIITFPMAILTLGLFLLVINALMILLASHFVPGFHVVGLVPAFFGAAALAVVGMLFGMVTKSVKT